MHGLRKGIGKQRTKLNRDPQISLRVYGDYIYVRDSIPLHRGKNDLPDKSFKLFLTIDLEWKKVDIQLIQYKNKLQTNENAN